MKRALILVDLQNDFFPNGSLPIPRSLEILPVINSLLDKSFDFKIATKDWHPANHMSFASVHGLKAGDKVSVDGLEQILWDTHCVQDTPGAEFYSDWHSEKIDQVITKGTDVRIDSYSTFFDNDHKKVTDLYDYLKKNKVDELYIAGLATDYCVKYSVLDAAYLGFKIYVVADACRAVNLRQGDEERAFEAMKNAGARIIDSHCVR